MKGRAIIQPKRSKGRTILFANLIILTSFMIDEVTRLVVDDSLKCVLENRLTAIAFLNHCSLTGILTPSDVQPNRGQSHRP